VDTILQNTVLLVLGVVVLVSLLKQTFLFFGILKASSKNSPKKAANISLIMAVKNEELIIEENVRKWLQVLPESCDVVVADDQSWDSTPKILEKLEEENPALHIVYLQEDRVRLSGKKFALTLAIKGAKQEAVLLTDADCYPKTEECMPLFSEKFEEGYSMVLGHSPIVGDAGFAGWLQKMEGLNGAISYTGFSSLGIYYMGVGRAIAYSKSIFLELGGFKALYKLPYGDDDLFVQKFAKHFKKTLLLNPKAFVETKAIEGIVAYWNQKRRHLSAGRKYKLFHKLLLMIAPLTDLGALGLTLYFLVTNGMASEITQLALVLFGAKTVLELIYNTVLSHKLAYGVRGLPLVFWQYVSPVFNAFVVFSLWIKPVKIWTK
jgi:cellulose synthase/poly-beta-1,6-N-acetylglucosamine synthase-like glycosyltransferase